MNIPLLEFLAEYANEGYADCSTLFREGGPLYNESEENDFGDCQKSSRALIASMKQDKNEDALHKIAFDDYEKGRMTQPRKVTNLCLDKVKHAQP